MTRISELIEERNQYTRTYGHQGTEEDLSINDISIDLIKAHKEQYGDVWLVNFNQGTLKKWKGERLTTFCADVIFTKAGEYPFFDKCMKAMKERKDYSSNIDAIFNHLSIANGIYLNWA